MRLVSIGLFFFFSLVPYASSAKPVCDAGEVSKVESALNSGKEVLILAWGESQACPAESETCGDWAEYLNRFVHGKGKTFKVLKIPHRKWPQIFGIDRTSAPEMSSLFMKKDRPSFLFTGAILEPDLYDLAVGALAGAKMPDGVGAAARAMKVPLCH